MAGMHAITCTSEFLISGPTVQHDLPRHTNPPSCLYAEHLDRNVYLLVLRLQLGPSDDVTTILLPA